MALLASLRKATTDVVRVSRLLEVLQVAGNASRVRASQVEVAIRVALLTSYSCVGPS
jgi:hypothetical protein